jgi:hypothetical protein
MENEIWKDIEGYEGYYQVSNLGRVKGVERKVLHPRKEFCIISEKLLKPQKTKNGYLVLKLHKDSIYKRMFVHRLVAIAFIENNNDLKDVNHINGIKTDNRIQNLEWCTKSQNQYHSYRIGLRNKLFGCKNGRSKLTEDQVYFLKYLDENKNLRLLALKYGVSTTTIFKIKKGKLWPNI